jgi:molybdopterin synthase catalytic subunit
MDLQAMIRSVKSRPDFGKAGMILCHNGVVRRTSRDGKPVTGLRISVDRERLGRIIEEQKKKPGILDVQVAIDDTRRLCVGDDVMFIVVAGDIRENVIAALTETLNRVKSEATSKEQFYS